jgi:GT2 family glycosyltransferase
LASDYPLVKVIDLPRNLGYAGGCNVGLRQATGQVLCILNNDTQVEPDWLAELLAALQQHPDAGMATSRVRLFDDRARLHTTGDFVRANGTFDSRGVWQLDEGQFDRQEYVFGAAGVAPAFRRSMLDDVGFFDADFGSYCEDVDLSWRAQLLGYKCIYAPRAVLYHKVSATGGGTTASFLVARNTIWVLAKNLPLGVWQKYRAGILAAQLARFIDAIRSWRGAAARATIRGQAAGLLGLPKMLRKRRSIQRRRRVSDAYIDSLLVKV